MKLCSEFDSELEMSPSVFRLLRLLLFGLLVTPVQSHAIYDRDGVWEVGDYIFLGLVALLGWGLVQGAVIVPLRRISRRAHRRSGRMGAIRDATERIGMSEDSMTRPGYENTTLEGYAGCGLLMIIAGSAISGGHWLIVTAIASLLFGLWIWGNAAKDKDENEP